MYMEARSPRRSKEIGRNSRKDGVGYEKAQNVEMSAAVR